LTVEYQERFYAAGKILGSRFLRRESRPSDEAILISRLIDRAIRPRFPKSLKREVQVIVTCLSWDKENDPDIPGLIAASVALGTSDIPWNGPVAILRVVDKENGFVLNPNYEERDKGTMEATLAGLVDKKTLINMIEASGEESEEELFLKAVEFAKPHLEKIISFQEEIIKKTGKKKAEIQSDPSDEEMRKEAKEFLKGKLQKAIFESKEESAVENLRKELFSYMEEKFPGQGKRAFSFFDDETDDIVHENAIKDGKRPDGRKMDELRKISAEIDILPRTHGSAIFQRGITKSLSILTLGAPEDVKLMEGMSLVGKKRFMHHYNFPPYCSGEIKPLRGVGRREIGHGMLAEKALLPLIPDFDQFPYTLRIVSEILSSNGSTSMASVCSSSLALMTAGVPVKNPAAGIAMGLMQNEKGEYKILTDIQGPEDHHGDMDFKVAGTEKGFTAIQLDVKISGVDERIIKEALEGAKKARLQILGVMKKAIEGPRKEISKWAPKIHILQINPGKIGEVIGPGGKMINSIIDEYGVSINIEDSGQVFVTAETEESAQKAIEKIRGIVREVEIGEVFDGKVKRIMPFGAFVEILPRQEGLVHISQLAPFRVEKVEDIIKVGDSIKVKVISIDEQGRINLSAKEAKK
jgi:polyribonucleotide nucleotidyltransferase